MLRHSERSGSEIGRQYMVSQDGYLLGHWNGFQTNRRISQDSVAGCNHLPGVQEANAKAKKESNTVGSTIRARVGEFAGGTPRTDTVRHHNGRHIEGYCRSV